MFPAKCCKSSQATIYQSVICQPNWAVSHPANDPDSQPVICVSDIQATTYLEYLTRCPVNQNYQSSNTSHSSLYPFFLPSIHPSIYPTMQSTNQPFIHPASTPSSQSSSKSSRDSDLRPAGLRLSQQHIIIILWLSTSHWNRV